MGIRLISTKGRALVACLLALVAMLSCKGEKPAKDAAGADSALPGSTDTDSGFQTDTETESESELNSNVDGGNQCLVVDTSSATSADTGTEVAHDTGSTTDSTTEAETGTPSESALDGGTDEDSDSVSPSDTDLPTDSDTTEVSDTDTGTSKDSDSRGPVACPPDMVYIPSDADAGVSDAFCIDRYEASRRDADGTSQGSDDSIALSVPGVIPWFVNPMSESILASFEAACAAAGKRLCQPDEWFVSCAGPEMNRYAFGNDFDREICNCVDTFCDDYCLANGIPEESCNLYSNCGYYCGTAEANVECFRVVPTGSFEGCTSGNGTFDIAGNVWEVVPSDTDWRGYEVRGGAFNCASAAARLQCTFNATWTSLYAGFRCCRTPD